MDGRCSTCKWAEIIRDMTGRLGCARLRELVKDAKASPIRGGFIVVEPDFGCVQWEKK